MKKMKVLQVNKLYYPDIGGIERTVQHIAEGLRSVVDMEVLVCRSKGKGSSEEINGIPVRRCGSFGTLFSLPISFGFLWEFRKQAKDQDIVHLHAPFPLGDLACLISGYGGKVVLYWHSDVVKQKKLMIFYRPIMNCFLKRVDKIIVGADGVVSGSSYLKPFDNKCVTIPFAVTPEIEQRGKEYLERTQLRKAGRVKFLFVGRLVYYKGVDVLLRAFTGVKNAELIIVGNGDLEASLRNYVSENCISDKVHFWGKVSEERLCEAFAECDVFVLPSVAKSEAFGLVQLEAMAYGKPVINTNLPSGVPEVSIHGITGLTVRPGDEPELADAMQWMVEHDEERLRMGVAARKRLDENYTRDVMLNRILDLYEKLIGG